MLLLGTKDCFYITFKYVCSPSLKKKKKTVFQHLYSVKVISNNEKQSFYEEIEDWVKKLGNSSFLMFTNGL